MSSTGSLIVANLGAWAVGQAPDELVTYALGSCVGVAAYDGAARCGGLWHVVLPDSRVNPLRAQSEPGVFADTGVGAFLESLAAQGAQRRSLRFWLTGGADSAQLGPAFEIGRRNLLAVRRLLWQQGLLVEGEDSGGSQSRTVRLDLRSGRIQIRHPWGLTHLGA